MVSVSSLTHLSFPSFNSKADGVLSFLNQLRVHAGVGRCTERVTAMCAVPFIPCASKTKNNRVVLVSSEQLVRSDLVKEK